MASEADAVARPLPSRSPSSAGSDTGAGKAVDARKKERRRRPPLFIWSDVVQALRARSQSLDSLFGFRAQAQLRITSSWTDAEGELYIRIQFGPEAPEHDADRAAGRNVAVHHTTLHTNDGSDAVPLHLTLGRRQLRRPCQVSAGRGLATIGALAQMRKRYSDDWLWNMPSWGCPSSSSARRARQKRRRHRGRRRRRPRSRSVTVSSLTLGLVILISFESHSSSPSTLH